MGPYATYLLETVLITGGICIVGAAVVGVARRLNRVPNDGAMRLVGHLPLEARRSIYLVEVGSQVLVVGASEAGFTKLGELEAGSLPPKVASGPRTFGDIFRRGAPGS
jgi:flagellar protein FliO/FliZ